MSVKVLKTNDTWYGMTYHEDVAAVKDSFKKMLADHCCGSLPIIYVRCPYESELLPEVLLYFLGTNFRFFSFAIQ